MAAGAAGVRQRSRRLGGADAPVPARARRPVRHAGAERADERRVRGGLRGGEADRPRERGLGRATPTQTDIARFWYEHPTAMWSRIFRCWPTSGSTSHADKRALLRHARPHGGRQHHRLLVREGALELLAADHGDPRGGHGRQSGDDGGSGLAPAARHAALPGPSGRAPVLEPARSPPRCATSSGRTRSPSQETSAASRAPSGSSRGSPRRCARSSTPGSTPASTSGPGTARAPSSATAWRTGGRSTTSGALSAGGVSGGAGAGPRRPARRTRPPAPPGSPGGAGRRARRRRRARGRRSRAACATSIPSRPMQRRSTGQGWTMSPSSPARARRALSMSRGSQA